MDTCFFSSAENVTRDDRITFGSSLSATAKPLVDKRVFPLLLLLGTCLGAGCDQRAPRENQSPHVESVNANSPHAEQSGRGPIQLTDVSKESGIRFVHTHGGSGKQYIIEAMSAGIAVFDFNGDGLNDVYFLNGAPLQGTDVEYVPRNALYRNDGNLHFTDVSKEAGVDSPAYGLGVTAGDYDGDGDIFVCNDVRGNFLFQNDGKGHFKEVGLSAGVAYSFLGKANGSMGADSADYDNDGWLDVFMTTYQAEMPVLYCNLGEGLFEDVTAKAGVARAVLPHVNWGTGFGDFDNDGDRDLFISNGHIEEKIHYLDDTTDYKVRNTLYLNNGDGTFSDVSTSCGSGMRVVASSRGTALVDMDNDGDLDVVIQNAMDKPTVLRNDTNNGNHWLQIRLRGSRKNLFGVGARVRVVAGDTVQVDEVHAGRGYQSYYGTRLHFGLGKHDRVDRVEIRWPDGTVDVVTDVAPDRLIVVNQGDSRDTGKQPGSGKGTANGHG